MKNEKNSLILLIRKCFRPRQNLWIWNRSWEREGQVHLLLHQQHPQQGGAATTARSSSSWTIWYRGVWWWGGRWRGWLWSSWSRTSRQWRCQGQAEVWSLLGAPAWSPGSASWHLGCSPPGRSCRGSQWSSEVLSLRCLQLLRHPGLQHRRVDRQLASDGWSGAASCCRWGQECDKGASSPPSHSPPPPGLHQCCPLALQTRSYIRSAQLSSTPFISAPQQIRR